MVLSMPGWFIATNIWGWDSPGSTLADALIIATNATVYSAGEILLLQVVQAVAGRPSK
jgi:hypothetical protein